MAHDHGQSGQNYCVGILSISNGVVYYRSNDGVHNFEIPVNSIKEARRNTVYLVAYEAFHIRQRGGTNYNFAALNAQGQHESPDAILNAINNAMGR